MSRACLKPFRKMQKGTVTFACVVRGACRQLGGHGELGPTSNRNSVGAPLVCVGALFRPNRPTPGPPTGLGVGATGWPPVALGCLPRGGRPHTRVAPTAGKPVRVGDHDPRRRLTGSCSPRSPLRTGRRPGPPQCLRRGCLPASLNGAGFSGRERGGSRRAPSPVRRRRLRPGT